MPLLQTLLISVGRNEKSRKKIQGTKSREHRFSCHVNKAVGTYVLPFSSKIKLKLQIVDLVVLAGYQHNQWGDTGQVSAQRFQLHRHHHPYHLVSSLQLAPLLVFLLRLYQWVPVRIALFLHRAFLRRQGAFLQPP